EALRCRRGEYAAFLELDAQLRKAGADCRCHVNDRGGLPHSGHWCANKRVGSEQQMIGATNTTRVSKFVHFFFSHLNGRTSFPPLRTVTLSFTKIVSPRRIVCLTIPRNEEPM